MQNLNVSGEMVKQQLGFRTSRPDLLRRLRSGLVCESPGIC